MEGKNPQQPIGISGQSGLDAMQLQHILGGQLDLTGNTDYSAILAQYQVQMPMQKDNKKSSAHHKFLQEDDEKLRQLVSQYGTSDWRNVASMMDGRSPRQCRDRWKNYLNPEVNNTPWTEAEDRLLDSKVAELGRKWSQIAKFFPGRTDINIKNRFTSHNTKIPKEIDTPIIGSIDSQAVSNQLMQQMSAMQEAKNE